MMGSSKKISEAGLALSAGLTGALCLGILSLVAMLGAGQELVNVLSSVLVGYEASAAGLFLGLVWGFFVGSAKGYAIAWFYNKML